MKRPIAALAIAFVLFSSRISGQDDVSSNPSMMKKPVFGTELAKLSFLVGTFTTETLILPSQEMPEGSVGRGASVITWGLDSMFLIIDETSDNPFLGVYKGHGLLGYNAAEKLYHLSMFNNHGDHPRYTGNFSGDTLILRAQVPTPGGFFDQKLLWFREGNLVKLLVLNDMGEGFRTVIDQTGTALRAGGK